MIDYIDAVWIDIKFGIKHGPVIFYIIRAIIISFWVQILVCQWMAFKIVLKWLKYWLGIPCEKDTENN